MERSTFYFADSQVETKEGTRPSVLDAKLKQEMDYTVDEGSS